MYRSGLFALCAAALLLVSMAACDFNAASDAIDNFDVLVELSPLKTVVSVQALNAATSRPISGETTVTLRGPDAGAAIDVFSDPVSELQFKGGFATFGLESSLDPSSNNPAELILRARAEGFVSTSVPLRVTHDGTIARSIQLVPENPNQTPDGTAGRRLQTSLQGDGTTGETVTIGTGMTGGDSGAQASARISGGTVLRTADGEPLQGQVTADLSVYDNSSNAQEVLPIEALTGENGARRLLNGAFRFQVRDESGQLAGQFGTTGEDTTSITAELPTLQTGGGSSVITLLNSETGETRMITANASGQSSSRAASVRSLSSKNSTGTWRFSISGNRLSAVSPTGQTFGPVTLNQVVQAGGFLASIGVNPPETCAPNGSLSIARNGQQGPIGLSFSGDGLSGGTTLSGSADPAVVSATSLLGGGPIPNVGDVQVTITAPDGQTLETTINWCSDTKDVSLPPPSGDRIGATIRVDPQCPKGERLPLTGNVDGYTLVYRQAGSDGSYITVDKNNIKVFYTNDSKETFKEATVDVFGVLPSTDYEFYTAFGEESEGARRIITMPGQDGGEVTLTDDELTELCE